jgi:hypothetical protein
MRVIAVARTAKSVQSRPFVARNVWDCDRHRLENARRRFAAHTRRSSNMKTLLILILLAFSSLDVARSEDAATPPPVTSDEWELILAAIPNASGSSSALSVGLKNAGIAMNKQAPKQATPTAKSNHIGLISALLLWHSSEIRTTFSTPEDKQQWQMERLALSQMLKEAKKNWGSGVVDQSWKNMMSACHVLGCPQGSLPD